MDDILLKKKKMLISLLGHPVDVLLYWRNLKEYIFKKKREGSVRTNVSSDYSYRKTKSSSTECLTKHLTNESNTGVFFLQGNP